MLARRFFGLLTLLALLLAPMGMVGGHMAMAKMAQAPASHCADMGEADRDSPAGKAPAQDIDCVIACACMPAPDARLAAPPLFIDQPQPFGLVLFRAGLDPAADPPPPRLS